MAGCTPTQEDRRTNACSTELPSQKEHRRYPYTSSDEEGALDTLCSEGIPQRDEEVEMRAVGKSRED